MLKLEKARSREINIVIRQREITFNKTFLTALAIALSFHFLAFLIFRIHTLFVIDEVLTSTFVESDVSNVSDEIFASIEENEAPKKFFFVPLETNYFPSMPLPAIIKHKDQLTDVTAFQNPFTSIEDDLDSVLFKNEHPKKPIQIYVSGHLSEITLLDDGTKDLETLLQRKKWNEDSYMVTFEVEADTQSGKIFWLSPKHVSNIPHLNRLAETIIHNMQFQPSDSILTRGFVDVIFTKAMQ